MQTLFTKSYTLKLVLLFTFIFSYTLISATPTITIIGKDSIKHQINTPYTDSGATAIDSANNNITSLIVTTGTVNVNVFGTYYITYTVTDSKGKKASATRTVIIGDCIPPIISTAPNTDSITVCVNDLTFTEPPVTATDNYFTTVNITRTGSYDITKLGDYTITYTATDGARNSSTFTRVIKVKACGKPVVISSGTMRFKLFDSIHLFLFQDISVIDPYYHPSYFINGTNGCSVKIISSNVDSSKVGLYQVIYQAKNGSDLVSDQHMRLVEVVGGLGITENTTKNKIKIYPNPTTDKITIALNTEGSYTAALSNIEGKTIFTKDITATNNTISVNNLEAGIYFLTVTGLNTLYTQKVILTK
jgi:hypothetical protein